MTTSLIPRLTRSERLLVLITLVVVALFTLMRTIFAVTIDLRVDEAYYWTWSKENVASFLDHPPLIAWLIRASTAILGDTNFAVRLPGLLAMLFSELLLAGVVWRAARDVSAACIAVLLMEATIDYGLLMVRIGPDTPLIPATLALAYALVRLAQSRDLSWWLVAGLCGGLALLSKYTAVLFLPAIAAFLLVPSWRGRHLANPYLWLGALIALASFAPVIWWNAQHDWVSFRFQLDRPAQTSGVSLKFLGEFLAQQFGLVGPLILPLIVIATAMLARRGWREREPVALFLSTAVIAPLTFLIWRSFYGRIGDGWPLSIWPFGIACVAINWLYLTHERPGIWLSRMTPSIASGLTLVAALTLYYVLGTANLLGGNDPIGKEAGFAEVVSRANAARQAAGASWFATSDYRMTSMLRWHLRDRVPVIQLNERNRFIGFKTFTNADLSGPALYVIPAGNPFSDLLRSAGAQFRDVGTLDLVWRGVRYDSYTLQRMNGFVPKLSPPAGDPLFVGRPH